MWFHRHQWAEVCRQQLMVAHTNWLFNERFIPSPVTVITFRCPCGAYRQRRLDGHVPAVVVLQAPGVPRQGLGIPGAPRD